METLNVICIGDIVGSIGRKALTKMLPRLQKEYDIHATIVNIENAANGYGLTDKLYKQLDGQLNIDVMTSGNHIYHQKDLLSKMDDFENLIRPINFSPDDPGKGSVVIEVQGTKVAVINAIGRLLMKDIVDDPFHIIKQEVEDLRQITPNIIVDFHAESPAEKMAMAVYMDGLVSCVYGTHTHVQTADERIFERGTAYISDIGCTGAFESILGMEAEQSLSLFLSNVKGPLEPPKKSYHHQLNGIVLRLDPQTGQAVDIERIQLVEKIQ